MVGVVSIASVFAVGCNRSETPAPTTQAATGASPGQTATPGAMPEHGQDLSITGCLTAGLDGRGFALTPSDSRPTEAGQALQTPGRETITYELVGNARDLERHANTIVTARGREDVSVARDAEVEREDESEQQPATGSSRTPTVETKEKVEVTVKRLHVASVVASGEACPSIGSPSGTATSPPRPGRGTP
jgi:hypothetical protein